LPSPHTRSYWTKVLLPDTDSNVSGFVWAPENEHSWRPPACNALQSGRQDALCKSENLEATRQFFIARLLVATDLIVSRNESTTKGLTKCQRVVHLDSRKRTLLSIFVCPGSS
jgi:hypothetical protein